MNITIKFKSTITTEETYPSAFRVEFVREIKTTNINEIFEEAHKFEKIITKEQLIDKLQEICDDLDDDASMVEDIPSTPLEDIDGVINGKRRTYGQFFTRKEEAGCLNLINNSCSSLDDIINELKESV